MTSTERVRPAAERVRDARARLEGDRDLWIATAAADEPWLIPLSFHWSGRAVLMATLRDSRTFRALVAGGAARLALGHTRDVVLLDGEVDLPDRLPDPEAEATAAAAGYDPRAQPDTGYLRFVPRRVQAWRNGAEIGGRTIMRDGHWLADP